MSDYLNNLLARSRSLTSEVRPRLAHPFETFQETAAMSFDSSMVGEMAHEEVWAAEASVEREAREVAGEPRPKKASLERAAPERAAEDALEPPLPSPRRASTTHSSLTSSPASLRQELPTEPHETEAPARSGLARESTEKKVAGGELQSPPAQPATAQTSREARRTSGHVPAFQPERDEAVTTPPAHAALPAQKSQPSLLHKREARHVLERGESEPAPHVRAHVSTRSTQSQSHRVAQGQNSAVTSAQNPATAPMSPDAQHLVAGKDSTVEAGSSRLVVERHSIVERPLMVERTSIVERTSMVTPDIARLETLTPALPAPTRPQPESTVRVTIGRIEVRAVMPPAAPAKERKRAAPKLSLNEYLRSQNGGRR